MKIKIMILLIITNITFDVVFFYKLITFNKYDINGDEIVNSKDLLDLKNYLLRKENN